MNFLFLNSARQWGGNEKWISLATKTLITEHTAVLIYKKETVGSNFDIPKFKLPLFNELDLYSLFRIIMIIKKYNVDILIPTKPKEYFLAGIASKICAKKNILRLGIVRDLKNSWIKNLVYNKLADKIIVNTPRIKEVLLKSRFMHPDKIGVIFNGLDIVDLERKSLVQENLTKPFNFLITTMGELSDRKGIDFLIKGFAQFVQTSKITDAGLLIIGQGRKRDELVALADQLDVSSRVTFTGFLHNPYPYLRMSDVFVLTSKNEGISNALIEAMYLKNSIITTDAGGVRQIIKQEYNGLLVPHDDISALQKSILLLYNDTKLRNRIVRNAQKTVRDFFSLDKMKNEIINFCS